MRFSENWLREWVDAPVADQALLDQLTMAGLEVASAEPAASEFDGVVVARIESVTAHPNADKLQICRVEAGAAEALDIVCGAPNARPGMLAPLAQVGAHLPGGVEVGAAKLRGVASAGMLCSARELGLSDDAAGLMELPPDAPVGQSLRRYLGLDDRCIEVDLTPNRGDCLALKGIAREVAALNGMQLNEPQAPAVAPTIDDALEVTLEAATDCPRYLGRVIRGIDPGARTPVWLAERLRRSGLRPIHPVVDATNYVMLELGQPMHAFDLAKLSGPIGVRRARTEETLELLDGTDAGLDEEFLLITDADRPVALGGVMGGLDTAVSADSRDLFLEAAYFNPATILGRARRLGIHSDAAHRFERGVDPQGQRAAMERMTALLLEIAGGDAGPITEAKAEKLLPVPRPITLRAARVELVLGIEVPRERTAAILRGLGMRVEETDEGWRVLAPSARFDLSEEIDLIEEVARIHGFEQIPEATPTGDLPRIAAPEERIETLQVARRLVDLGYSEAINYSFVAASQLEPMKDGGVLELANPLSVDLKVMRTSLMPGLLAALVHNQNRQAERVRLFETGVCFPIRDGDVHEETRIAAVISGNRLPEQWCADAAEVDFYDVKGDLEALLELTGDERQFGFRAAARAFLHPGQGADLVRGDRVIGWVGAIHPRWLERLDARGGAFGFELDLAGLQPAVLPKALDLSRFPSIRRDLALVVDRSTEWNTIRQIVEETAGNLLTKLVVFDDYRGAGIADRKKSLAIGVVLQDHEKTLTDAVVDAVVGSIVTRLKHELNAVLRG